MCAGVEEVRLEPVAQRAAAMMLAHNEKEPALQVPHRLAMQHNRLPPARQSP
jgi:hypothetical protein